DDHPPAQRSLGLLVVAEAPLGSIAHPVDGAAGERGSDLAQMSGSEVASLRLVRTEPLEDLTDLVGRKQRMRRRLERTRERDRRERDQDQKRAAGGDHDRPDRAGAYGGVLLAIDPRPLAAVDLAQLLDPAYPRGEARDQAGIAQETERRDGERGPPTPAVEERR